AFPVGLPETTAGNLRDLFHVPIPASVPDGTLLRVHPTQLYETTLALIIWGIAIWMFRRRRPGQPAGAIALTVLALLAVERFAGEVLRAKDDRFLGPFTLAQAFSVLVLLIVGVVAWLRRGRTAPQPAR